MKKFFGSKILLSVVMTATLYAGGDNFSPRLVGMGRTFTAISRGLDAVGTNPANLSLNDRDATFTFNLIPLGVSAGSDFINYGIYTDFFTGVPDPQPDNPDNKSARALTEADKDKILDLFPGGLSYTQARVGTSPFAFSIQAGDLGFAFVPSVQVASNIDLPEGFLGILLKGFKDDPNGTSYNIDNTNISASAVAEFNLSAAYLLPVQVPSINEISVGLGVKYFIGLGYTGTERYNSVIETKDVEMYTDEKGSTYYLPRNIHANIDFLQYFAADTGSSNPSPVGSGLGFDIGVSALVANSIRVGISVTDIGTMKWDKYTKAIYGRGDITLNGIDPKYGLDDSLTNIFKGKTVDTTAFEYSLPTALHIGGAMQVDEMITSLPFRWAVAVDMHFGFNNVPGNTTRPQFSVGTELDPLTGWLPLRTGIIIGGRQRFGWSGGFGLHLANTFDLDFATQSVALLAYPESFRTLSFVVGMRLRF